MNYYSVIGAAIGSNAGISGCEKAPELIRYKLPYLAGLWEETIYCPMPPKNREIHTIDPVETLATFSRRLAQLTQRTLELGSTFLTFGGDHSCAIGTWTGVSEVHEEFGLIWIDAHMDAHTPKTSPSGNLHGMPVACLLGHGDKRLTKINGTTAPLKPENLVMVGVRSYEEGEAALLRGLGVKIYTMDEVQKLGFGNVMRTVQKEFASRSLPFGVSLDFDALDPKDFIGLGTPEHNGIRLEELLTALDELDYSHLLGIEFAEYNPSLDTKNFSSIQVIDQVLHHIRGLNTMPFALAK